MNNRHPSISEGLFQSLSKIRANHEFEDLKVEIDGVIHSCHSFILASCSDFFSALLRSNMKEKQEMLVHLKNISSPIFQLVLDSLYTGCELLTKENVLEVWSAVHQLQIQFIIEHCEDFVLANLSLDTAVIYKVHAEYLQSVRLCEHILNFMCKHFGTYRKTEIFLRMNFQEFIEMIKSDKLEVNSEDEVLYSIFDWVLHEDLLPSNHDTSKDETAIDTDSTIEKELAESATHKIESIDRKKMLVPLLKATRYCLASEFCLTLLYENKLTQRDSMVKDILFEALSYKTSGYWHEVCHTSAFRRDCAKVRDVAVYCCSANVNALCFKKNERFSITNLPFDSTSLPFNVYTKCNLAVYNRELYACITNMHYTYNYPKIPVLKLTKDGWESVTDLNTRFNDLFVPNDKYLYCFNWRGVIRFNPNQKPIEIEQFSFHLENIEYAFSFYNYIILFSSEYNDKLYVEETNIHSWNTETQVCTKIDHIEFTCKSMISFRNGRVIYILDHSGNLWKLTQGENIGFTFIRKLWREYCYLRLKGAFLSQETLFIVVEPGSDDVGLIEVEGVFSSIRLCEVSSVTSNCIYYAIPSDMITPVEDTETRNF